MSVQNLINSSFRRIGNVHPVIKKGAEEITRRAYKEGIYVIFSDGYRSNAEQNALYAQGRTKPGSIVTNARAGYSYHNFGLALDYFMTNKVGTTANWSYGKDWQRVADISKDLGFEWGGDWTSFLDRPHIQMIGGLSTAQLRAGRKPNIALKGGTSKPKPAKPSTSKPSVSKPSKPTASKWKLKSGKWTGQTLVKGDYGPQVKDLQTMMSKNNPPFYPAKGTKNDGIDTYFGGDTEGAVTRFQRHYSGVEVDGKAGKQVYNKLVANSKPAKKPAAKPKPVPKPKPKAKPKVTLPTGTLKRGDKGPRVELLQVALNKANFKVGKVDGDFGKKTEDALIRFQKVHDATDAKYIDGVYGSRARTRLAKLV